MKIPKYLIILILFILIIEIDSLTNSEKAEEIYKFLLKKTRAEQLDAVKSLKKIKNYESLQQMILIMGEKIFSIILDSRAKIESSSYIPGISEFPLDRNISNSLSSIIENTSLFSEILLRYPDITVALLKINNNWDVLLQWSIAFCNEVKYLLDNSTVKLLNLVSQELNHIPRSPNYFNPYRIIKNNLLINNDIVRSKKKVKKVIKKGPRLSHWEL